MEGSDYGNIIRNNNCYTDEEWAKVLAGFRAHRRKWLGLYPGFRHAAIPADAHIGKKIRARYVILALLAVLGICWLISSLAFWIAVFWLGMFIVFMLMAESGVL